MCNNADPKIFIDHWLRIENFWRLFSEKIPDSVWKKLKTSEALGKSYSKLIKEGKLNEEEDLKELSVLYDNAKKEMYDSVENFFAYYYIKARTEKEQKEKREKIISEMLELIKQHHDDIFSLQEGQVKQIVDSVIVAIKNNSKPTNLCPYEINLIFIYALYTKTTEWTSDFLAALKAVTLWVEDFGNSSASLSQQSLRKMSYPDDLMVRLEIRLGIREQHENANWVKEIFNKFKSVDTE